ncbi:MAG: bifunctional UDP-N-acetylmuramoyl-tripeptide:D-alanyl-D-alanine ligase/alanine racemase [Bacteroidales bacterium]
MDNKVTINTLATLCNGTIIGKNHKYDKIENILFDSRRLNSIQGTVFFALKTDNNDGSHYINELYNKGVRIFVTQTNPNINYKDATFVLTDDVLNSLQILAREYRNKFFIPDVVAITGSNGKTIVKDWIVRLINSDKKVCANIKSFNSQIGVPISVYELKSEDEVAIFEAGISLPNEMENLEKIIQPTIGLFTNIGDAHQINFTSIEQKIEEKLKLFTHCKKLVFHDSDSILTNKIIEFAKQHSIELIAWGEKQNSIIEKYGRYYNQNSLQKNISLPFSDKASVENAINAYILCLSIGIEKQHLQQRIKKLEQIESRFEIKNGINNSLIVNDSYSCDLKSLEIALDYLNRQNKSQKIAILSDLQQSNTNPEEMYSQINKLLINKKIHSLIAIGGEFYNNQDKIHIEESKFYLTVEDFLLNLRRKDFVNKAILIKGANQLKFERISNILSNKVHQSVLEINLSALEDNVKYFHSLIKPNTMVMAMVKASSYGCGSYEVAYTLEKSNLADYFAVAFADEGVELRCRGIQKPIIIMTPEAESTYQINQYKLEPVIHSFEVLERFIHSEINIHLKLDTGMHRLGFEPKDINRLVTTLETHPKITIKSVFSHLYGADDTKLDKYTLKQIDLYEQMSSFICHRFNYKILRHLCNSAATIRFPQAHYDMVRLGIGMYGIGINPSQQQQLRFVHRLRTTITQIREIGKGEDVSYSRKFVSPTQMRIGVIPIGYADGLNRHLGNSNYSVYVNGTYCDIIGNICMDMCMINLTSAHAKEGDTVVIFASENPVFKLSKCLDTIPYEIFTSISQRIQRIYYHE